MKSKIKKQYNISIITRKTEVCIQNLSWTEAKRQAKMYCARPEIIACFVSTWLQNSKYYLSPGQSFHFAGINWAAEK